MPPHMYPEFLNQSDVRSQAEVKLYDAFKQQLHQDFHVFHSVAWLGIRRNYEKPSDGETDFVIAHPRMGILILEVKGGIVGFDSGEGWHSIRRDNTMVDIKNPFTQVKDNKYALLKKIRSLPNWPGHIPTLGHAVAFPDGITDLSELSPAAPGEIILLYEDLGDVDRWVRDCLSFWAGNDFVAPGEDGVYALKTLLARSWLLREPKMGEEINIESTAIDRLTEQQFQLLDILGGRPKAVIRGCAGSGKTMLAVMKSRQLAREGFRVLLTCYNRNLSDELRRSSGNPPRLKIQNFHSLCREFAALTGFDRSPNWDENDPTFFDSVMPDALVEAAGQNNEKFMFDAIIADEGQDFSTNWWSALELLLNDSERGVFYIFYDDNQLVYPRQLNLPVKESAFALTVNCRNTRYIHEAVTRFYNSDLHLRFSGPDGRPVAITPYEETSTSLRAAITEILARLIYAEEIPASDIVLLSSGGKDRPPLSDMTSPSPFHLVSDPADSENAIYTTTIRLFKGLERPVVILIMPVDKAYSDELMYIGLSRACNHVEVLVSEEFSEGVIQRLN